MTAPEVRLASSDGIELSLGDLRGRPVVLYFYPKDSTPGCTREACAFRDARAELAELGAVVLGVSMDSLKSHQKFRETHQLNFPLLSDPEGRAITAFGAWKTGQEGKSVNRSTFLIDGEGVIRRIWRSVRVEGHDAEVLEALRSLSS